MLLSFSLLFLLIESLQTDACEHLLGVEGKVACHHPAVIAGVGAQHVSNGASAILAEVERLEAALLSVSVQQGLSVGTKQRSPYDASSKVYVVVLLREVGKEVHVVLQHAVRLVLYAGRIHVELTHQHTVCGFGVLVSTVSREVVLHLASAEELGMQQPDCGAPSCGRWSEASISRHFEKSKLMPARRNSSASIGTSKWFGVVSGKITARHYLVELRSQFLERLGVLNIVVRDAGKLGHFLRDGLTGIDEEIATNLLPLPALP